MLEARNAGKPIGDARGEMGMVVDTFRYYAGAPERLLGDTIPVAGGVGVHVPRAARRRRADHAVELPAVRSPAWKMAPALAAGNTVVLKPAELTPLTALRFEQLALEAGLPEGVVNVVVGPGLDVRRSGSSSTPTSRRSRSPARPRSAARSPRAPRETIKRVTLELGGKSANVVFADADLEKRRGRRAGRGVRQRRPGLLRALADPRRALGARRASWPRSRTHVAGDRASATRSTRRRQMGPLISRRPARDGARPTCPTDAPVAIRGTAPDGPGFWFPPTVLVPGRARRPRGARGDLRPGRRRHPVRRRGGGDRAGQRHDLRAVGLGLDARRREGAARRPRDRDRQPVAQLEHLGAGGDAVRRLQAVGRRARARPARARPLHRGQDRSSSRRRVSAWDGSTARSASSPARRAASAPRPRALFTRRGRDGRRRRPRRRRPAATSRCGSTSPTRTQSSSMYARTREEFGRIDVLFNNAGISPTDDGSVLDTSLEAWQRVQDVNLKSVFLCCKHGIPHLLEGGGGSVINTASFVAVMGAATSQISYTASKGGVLAHVARDGRPVRPPGRPRQRAVPRARSTRRCCRSCSRSDPSEAARAGSCTCRWAASPRRARSPTARCSSPPTSRRT